MIEKYTPRTRLRKMKKPTDAARRAGTTTAAATATGSEANGRHQSGNESTLLKKKNCGMLLYSGRTSPPPEGRLRCMAIA